MGRMVRKQIVMDPEQERALEERAQQLGVSQSSLIRDALERFLAESEEEQRRAAAWERLKRGWEEADRLGIGSGGRKWTREELHERPGPPRH